MLTALNASRSSRVLLSFLLFFFLSSSLFAFPAKVVKISDGDTITVLTPDYQQIRVRLYGIDCPEKRQAFGSAATRFTRDMVAGKEVEITDMGKDRYGRMVGIVGNLNQALIEAGLAWVYPQYCKLPVCKDWYQLQKQARQNRVGIWSDPEPVAPWKWRNASLKKFVRTQ